MSDTSMNEEVNSFLEKDFDTIIDLTHQILARLKVYENKYGMNSHSFYKLFEAQQLPKTIDYLRWRSQYYAYRKGMELIRQLLKAKKDIATQNA